MGNPKRQLIEPKEVDEVEILKQIAEDPDDSVSTEQEMSLARPFAEALPELYESIMRARGRPPIDNPKQQITLRLDQEVITKFKATGKGWQSRINEVLRQAKL